MGIHQDEERSSKEGRKEGRGYKYVAKTLFTPTGNGGGRDEEDRGNGLVIYASLSALICMSKA